MLLHPVLATIYVIVLFGMLGFFVYILYDVFREMRSGPKNPVDIVSTSPVPTGPVAGVSTGPQPVNEQKSSNDEASSKKTE